MHSEIQRYCVTCKLTLHIAANNRQSHEFKQLTVLSRGTLVEYAQKISLEEDSHEVEMIEACQDCRICVVRKRETSGTDSKGIRMMTSVWVFSDDNIVRLQLKLADGEMYVPYSSYFNQEKISMTVPCELKYHDMKYGTRLLKSAKTSWINYVFKDTKGMPSLIPEYSIRQH